jgi:lipid II:glycine glycyltransferase (peptidoglycan interpeptide bridge formation enzyme)
MPFEIVNPLEISDWNNDVLSLGNNNYSIFHSVEWAKLLHDSYNYTPNYLISKSNNVFTSIIPFMLINNFRVNKRMVSLPFSDYCEPLVSNEKHFKTLLDYLISHCEKQHIRSFEIRGGKEYLTSAQSAYSYYEHILGLGGKEEELFKKFNETTRRNIKKAINEEIQASIDYDLNSLNEFYRLNCITRKKHGLPPQPKSFFIKIFQYLIKSKIAFIVSAKYNGETIASSIYMHFGKKAYYKYGASDGRFQNLRPNNLVMWEAIKHFNERKFNTFHFGRTEFVNDGLRRFKLGWGTVEKTINAYNYSIDEKAFVQKNIKTTGLHNVVFSKLPIPILKSIGSAFYKYMG